MNPAKVKRNRTIKLTDLPNVGPATAKDFHLLGISKPNDLVGRDPVVLYQQLIKQTGVQHDPCVLDVFMSVIDFMNGNPPKPWWKYTDTRKNLQARAGGSPTGRGK